MNPSPLLITSFQPWRAHQSTNTSDDLIAALQSDGKLPNNSIWLRNIPVSFDLAPIRVISELCRYRPHAVICCGMAENRPYLSIEQRAIRAGQQLQTSVNLQKLLQQTLLSEISYNSCNYVGNALYYSVLASIQKYKLPTVAIFAHIPILKGEGRRLVLSDFSKIAEQLAKPMSPELLNSSHLHMSHGHVFDNPPAQISHR